jgi:glycosyltransferase involved in cell wall biosynthesis
MNEAKVSVSVVTYNHEDFLERCLDSVLGQKTDFPFEIVVGDDHSTDRTPAIVQEYARRYPGVVVPIFQSRNVGAAKNWQAVLDKCSGQYIAHLDGDDLMRPGKLQRQADFLDDHPEVSACFHNMRVFDSDTGATLYLFTPPDAPRRLDLEGIVRQGTIYCHSSKMYRRSSLPSEGLDQTTKHIMDWLVHIQNARHGFLAYIDEVLGDYRKHKNAISMVGAQTATKLLGDQLYTIQRAGTLGASNEAIEAAASRAYYNLALKQLRAGDSAGFRENIERSASSGVRLTRAHNVAYSLRKWPSAVRLFSAIYERTVIRRQLWLRSVGSSTSDRAAMSTRHE